MQHVHFHVTLGHGFGQWLALGVLGAFALPIAVVVWKAYFSSHVHMRVVSPRAARVGAREGEDARGAG